MIAEKKLKNSPAVELGLESSLQIHNQNLANVGAARGPELVYLT